MKSIAVFLLFVGMFMLTQGFYDQKMSKCPTPKVVVKFIPRTLYEEQLSDESRVSQQFKTLFDDISPWPTVRG